MSDLISRQAAIEAIDSFNVFESRCDQIKLEQMIGELPPAQPALCEDAVSRKAVAGIYTALWETIGTIMDRDEWDDVCKATANELPPAQLSTNLAEVGTDLISRQALLDKFEPWLKVKDYNDGELNMLKAILYEIRFMRSAEPKRGWWIEIINSRGVVVALRCSRCEKSPRHGVRSDFCPNCGADMREVTT